jgi:hypothetical protein
MSTSYYDLMEGITSLRLEEGPAHDRLTVFDNHANCGTLTLALGRGRTVALAFAIQADDQDAPIRTHWGGKDVGSVVTEHRRGLADDYCLVSEYGEVLTVGQIRARAGARRKDAMPTELFGYEEAP